MLSKRARNTLAMLAKAARGHPRLLSEDAMGRKFKANGKPVKESGALQELIDAGVLRPSGDALLPGMTQTYQFNPEATA
jgi:hypothetical protein